MFESTGGTLTGYASYIPVTFISSINPLQLSGHYMYH
jgi:hypothetical protein